MDPRPIDVILPALDEADALPDLIADFPPGFRPLVVDNGSTDGTAEVAARAGATVVEEPQRGFGAACWTGLNAATSDIVCFMDADGSHHPRHLPLIAAAIETGAADLMVSARLVEPGAMPPHARLANAYLARRVGKLAGVKVRDIGPMRAARRDNLLALGLTDRRFGWPLEMVLRAGRAGWRVHDVGIPYERRVGRSKVTGTVRGTARAVKDMSRYLREFDRTSVEVE